MDVVKNSVVLRIAFVIALIAITAGAFAFRYPRLEQRPMHCDEAVHAVKAGDLIEKGQYIYDPHDYHGPTIYYFALPFVWGQGAHTLQQTSEWMFRIVPVLFGTALILLLFLVRDGLGRGSILIAALLTAVSPAMVFYSRYYIQEMVFVFFTFGMLASGWRYSRSRQGGWLLASGICAGFMHATKETCVLVWFAMGVALLVAVWPTWQRDGIIKSVRDLVNPYWVLAALVGGFLVSAFFLSGGFHNPRAILDGVLTYASYFKRADGVGMHDHPWDYYLRMLAYSKLGAGVWWSEGLILVLAACGLVVAWRQRSDRSSSAALIRFLAVYTVVLTAVYSAVPYKTPWCLLGFLHGMILLAGVGAVAVLSGLRKRPLQAMAFLLLLLGIGQLGQQAYRANYRYYADTRNPYVYAHTANDFLNFVKRMEELAAVAPEGHNILIKVVTPDCWPMPWYLRDFPRVGYWQDPISDQDADIVVTSLELNDEVAARLKQSYHSQHYGLRPEVPIVVYIKEALWDAFMKTRG